MPWTSAARSMYFSFLVSRGGEPYGVYPVNIERLCVCAGKGLYHIGVYMGVDAHGNCHGILLTWNSKRGSMKATVLSRRVYVR